jgi:PKD repeat protein
MKKLLLSATACLSVFATINAQNILPCNTYGVRETYLKTVPGYAAKLNAAEAAAAAEYQAFLLKANSAAKATTSGDPTYTVPVVFHVLHLGETPGSGSNIDDQICIDAVAQINKDYARQGIDTTTIDVIFEPLYENAHMQFMLAQKDPQGNCTNGVVHHYNPKTVWDQNDLFNYQYSTYATGNWNPSKYLNIYIVKNIVSSGSVVGGGIIVGYTHLPGTAPIDPADAIVYRNDFLYGLDARSLSHEIGHWFGLSHTFGATNDPGFECGNDDIGDTPKTTGFFSTCPKPANYLTAPSVTTPADSSDIVKVKFGAMTNTTALNSLSGKIIRPLITLVATTVTPTSDTANFTATGTAGGYSDFSNVYGNDFNAATTNTISITSLAKSTDNNYVGVYFDYNRNGSFADAGEAVYIPTVTVVNYNVVPLNAMGTNVFNGSNTPLKINKTYTVVTGTPPSTVISTFTTTPDSFVVAPAKVIIPSGLYGLIRMRVITSNTPITGPTMTPGSGEFEEYNFNIGTTPSPTTGINKTMATCDTVRPNIENFMDYSSCPKMFTKGQNDKVRQSATSMISNRALLISDENLYFTGILGTKTFTTVTTTTVPVTTYTTYLYSNPTTVTPCAPIADFSLNKVITCAGQSITFNNTSYNSSATSTFDWVFEGGTPATSTLATQSVTYSTPGDYSVSLTTSNVNGSSTKTANSIVSIKWNAGQISLPYVENFESGQWWPSGWNIINSDFGTHGWEMSNYGAGTLSSSYKSLVLGNANYTSNFPGFEGNTDIAETPSFDFSNTTNISFAFDYSFARKTGVVADTFKVQYSLDCGGSWKTFLGSSTTAAMVAATGGTVNAPYLPLSSSTSSTVTNPKWKTMIIPTVGTTPIANKRDVKFRFWFKNDADNGQSQNLYIDNINIGGTVGIHEFENSLGLSIYPNPTNSSSTVEFTSPKNSKVNIIVYDVTGRVIEENNLDANAGVSSKYLVNSSNKLKAGIYFVTLVIDNNKITKKLIIE